MRNPFKDLGAPRLENPQGEEVGGNFACQTFGCFEDCTEARYLEETGLLTWICREGHTSHIENFRIDY